LYKFAHSGIVPHSEETESLQIHHHYCDSSSRLWAGHTYLHWDENDYDYEDCFLEYVYTVLSCFPA